MTRNGARLILQRLLLTTLFLVSCFPSRGLYFLLHSPQSDRYYHTSQPVFDAPTNPKPKLKAAKQPLPLRLTRIPRTVKPSPAVPVETAVVVAVLTPDLTTERFPRSESEPCSPQTLSSARPPGRAPPAAL